MQLGTVGFGSKASALGAIEHRAANAFGGAFSMYQNAGDATPTLQLVSGFGGPKIILNDGSLGRAGFNPGWEFRPAPWRGSAFAIPPDSNGASLDGLGVGGLFGGRISVQGPIRGGINDPVHGDSIVDGSNGPNGSFFNMIDVRQSGSWAHGTRGSLHQFQGSLELVNPAGETNIYCEGFNCYFGIVNNRRGPLVGNWESDLSITSGNQARAAGIRAIIREENAYASSYTSAIFGTQQNWHLTGARGFEAIAMPSGQGGTSQRPGTGILIHGIQGWEWALQVLDASANRVSGIDGNGGVFTRTKAGAPVDGDYRQPISGLMAVDTTNSKLYVRVGTTWKSTTLTV